MRGWRTLKTLSNMPTRQSCILILKGVVSVPENGLESLNTKKAQTRRIQLTMALFPCCDQVNTFAPAALYASEDGNGELYCI